MLQNRFQPEILHSHKKFGLVFEEHLPECTPLYDVPIKKGSRVAVRDTEIKETFTVLSVEDGTVKCVSNNDKELHEFPLNDLVTVAEFGEPIYPYLQTIDTVCNAPDSDLWHTLIEADNYHALQLLEYMYAGKVDCIYIDPPYNKEDSKDWKYNCNYVDGNDMYRHSKWLSMMERRLKLAKKLLNPKDSVLIVTIDELEYLHLGMLLENIFPEARMQMVSIQITPQGNPRVQQFYRTNEYAFILGFGAAQPSSLPLGRSWRTGAGDTPQKNINWVSLLRTGTARKREDRPYMFYPFFIKDTADGPIIDSIGEPFLGEDYTTVQAPAGTVAVWPIGRDGELRRWQVSPSSALKLKEDGFLRLGRWNGADTAIQYLAESNRNDILNGDIPVNGRRYDGSYIVDESYKATFIPGTIWKIPSHDATRMGSQLLSKILGEKRFDYPKSLYAVYDTLRFYVADKPNAVILDFFAGSGTTLHAVNLLNAADNGHRRCIMVTNNEIGDKNEAKMRESGYRPGDYEWESIGIAKYTTWPRTVCSIRGTTTKGKTISGNYGLYHDEYIPDEERRGTYKKIKICDNPEVAHINYSDGFKANAIYFKLGFLDKNAVALGRQFKELLGVLWMKAGAIGPCPDLAKNATVPEMMILPQNKMAILVDDTAFATFAEQMKQHPEIETVYIVTDSDRGYREMSREISVKNIYQLYRDYLDNFRINHRR